MLRSIPGTRRCGILVGIAVAFVSADVSGQARRSPPRPTEGPIAEHPFIELDIPRLSTERDVRRWADDMQLSEGQRVVFLGYYEALKESEAGKPAEELTALWDWSASLGPVHGQAYSDLVVANELADLTAAAARWVDRLIAAERSQLFELMRSILAEHQQVLLTRVAQRRECSIYQMVDCFHFPAKVDLVALLDELQDDEVVTINNRNDVDAILSEYGSSMLRLWRGFAEAIREVYQRGPLAEAEELLTGSSANAARVRRLLGRAAARATSICHLNDVYADVLAESLQGRSRQMFLREYRLRAHPQVYPNPYDPAPIFEAARELPGLTEEQLQEIVILADATDISMTAVCDRMNVAIRNWLESFISKWSSNAEAKQQHIEALTAAHAERKLIAEGAIAELQEIIGEDGFAAIRDEVQAFSDNAARLKPREEGLHYFVAYAGADNIQGTADHR